MCAETETKERPKRYLVTGAAGHLGSTILRLLKERGAQARGLLLPGEEEKVAGPGIAYVRGNVCDPDSLRPLFEGGEGMDLIVIHTAAIISIAAKAPPALSEVNVGGTKNVLKLCREYGVKRLVHVSSVHAIPELPKDQIIREVDAYSPDLVEGGYAKTKAEAAQAVLDAAKEGLDAVIVLPSGILGPYDDGNNHLTQMVRDYIAGRLPACVRGGYDFVDVRDAAEGCLLAAEKGRAGESYILSGHRSSVERLLLETGRRCGREKAPVLPMPLARAAVPFISLFAVLCRRRPLYTSYSLDTLHCNSRFSNEKAKTELGYTTRPLAETVSDMTDYLCKKEK